MIEFRFEPMQPFSRLLEGRWPSSGVTALFAPSGAGKTRLMRFFAGLAQVSQKDFLHVEGEFWLRQGRSIPLHRRDVACVFQHHSLLVHLSVEKNIAFAQRFHKGRLTSEQLAEIFDVFSISSLLQQMPHILSGGERQRVILAIALLQKPRWLLLDEPMTGIDYKHKKVLLKFIKKFCLQHGVAVFMISHYMDEVMEIADYLVLMRQGEFVADGPFVEVVNTHQPFENASEGAYQLFEMTVTDTLQGVCQLTLNKLVLMVVSAYLTRGEKIRIKVAARDVSISLQEENNSMLNTLQATISDVHVERSGAYTLVRLNISGHIVFSEISTLSFKRLQLKRGMSVFAQIKATALRV